MRQAFVNLFTNWLLLIPILTTNLLLAQGAMINVDARNTTSLNGIWPVIIDPTGIGDWRQVWLAAYWSEEYREQIYKNQIKMFNKAPNLSGVCPWLLVDYRSPGRMHPIYQNGYNRKGLISDKGEKKKAWYVIKQYFENIK